MKVKKYTLSFISVENIHACLLASCTLYRPVGVDGHPETALRVCLYTPHPPDFCYKDKNLPFYCSNTQPNKYAKKFYFFLNHFFKFIFFQLYTPLNIFVALVGVEVWTESDAIAVSPNGNTSLGNFLRYRREVLVKSIPNDNAQLLT